MLQEKPKKYRLKLSMTALCMMFTVAGCGWLEQKKADRYGDVISSKNIGTTPNQTAPSTNPDSSSGATATEPSSRPKLSYEVCDKLKYVPVDPPSSRKPSNTPLPDKKAFKLSDIEITQLEGKIGHRESTGSGHGYIWTYHIILNDGTGLQKIENRERGNYYTIDSYCFADESCATIDTKDLKISRRFENIEVVKMMDHDYINAIPLTKVRLNQITAQHSIPSLASLAPEKNWIFWAAEQFKCPVIIASSDGAIKLSSNQCDQAAHIIGTLDPVTVPMTDRTIVYSLAKKINQYRKEGLVDHCTGISDSAFKLLEIIDDSMITYAEFNMLPPSVATSLKEMDRLTDDALYSAVPTEVDGDSSLPYARTVQRREWSPRHNNDYQFNITQGVEFLNAHFAFNILIDRVGLNHQLSGLSDLYQDGIDHIAMKFEGLPASYPESSLILMMSPVLVDKYLQIPEVARLIKMNATLPTRVKNMLENRSKVESLKALSQRLKETYVGTTSIDMLHKAQLAASAIKSGKASIHLHNVTTGEMWRPKIEIKGFGPYYYQEVFDGPVSSEDEYMRIMVYELRHMGLISQNLDDLPEGLWRRDGSADPAFKQSAQ